MACRNIVKQMKTPVNKTSDPTGFNLRIKYTKKNNKTEQINANRL